LVFISSVYKKLLPSATLQGQVAGGRCGLSNLGSPRFQVQHRRRSYRWSEESMLTRRSGITLTVTPIMVIGPPLAQGTRVTLTFTAQSKTPAFEAGSSDGGALHKGDDGQQSQAADGR
jgi:hypothetical protein